jgi:competence protein ComEC
VTPRRLVALLGVACGAVWAYAFWSGAVVALFAAGPAASPAAKSFEEGKVTIAFLDVGQGDCIFIHTPNGRNVLIDAGEGPNPENPFARSHDAGREVVLPFLRAHGVRRLDAIVLSHPHSDHGGGLETLLAAEDIEVGAFYDAGIKTAAKFYKNVLRRLEEKHPNAAYHTVLEYIGDPAKEESKFRTDYRLIPEMIGKDILEGDPSAQLLILGPVQVNTQRSFANDNSIFCLLRAGNVTVTFTGDAEPGLLSDMFRLYGENLRTLVMKAPHHGSRFAVHEGLYRAASPRYVVFQVSATNTYGHPHKDQVGAWLSHVSPPPTILRNDLHGDILLITDGRSYRWETEREVPQEEARVGREFQRRRRGGAAQGGAGGATPGGAEEGS